MAFLDSSGVTRLCTDLKSRFAPNIHNHAAKSITSGVLAIARIPTGTTSSTVALGNHTHSGYQPTLVSGTNIKTINSQSLLGSGNLAIQELPTVTSSDNGKILQVVDGAWAAASIPSASGVSF